MFAEYYIEKCLLSKFQASTIISLTCKWYMYQHRTSEPGSSSVPVYNNGQEKLQGSLAS